MKHAKKVIISIVNCIICIFIMLCCTGCFLLTKPEPKPVEYVDRECGDFVVRFYDEYCEIKGTTEQGNDKKFLVIPKSIEGIKVISVGYQSFGGGFDSKSEGELTFPDIKSDRIEKVFFEAGILSYPLGNSLLRPKLTKVIYPNVGNLSSDFVDRVGRFGVKVYVNRFIYINWYINENVDSYYKHFVGIANVSYYYNYENAANDGYYWIDDCEYGSRIEYIPKDPEREGYIFGGWYKEEECINKWDFDSDTLPEKQTKLVDPHDSGEFVEVTVYQETVLYAKWISDQSAENR